MTYKNIAAALCLVGLTFGANAGQLGFAHNQHLSCLLKINPTGQMPMHKVLQALVLKCRFNPGMPVNQFVKI